MKQFSTLNFIENAKNSLAEKFKLQAAQRNKNINKTNNNYNNNINNNLIKVTNKPFLRKYFKGYFERLVLNHIKKDIEYVEVTEPVMFENGKLIIFDVDPAAPGTLIRRMFMIIFPLIGLAGYKFCLAIYSFSFLRTIFWSSILMICLKLRSGVKNNIEHIIKEMSVLEDGKTCEITTNSRKFTVDINDIRKLNLEEAMYMINRLDSIKINFIPIVFKDKMYLIPIESRIHHKDFLCNISEGKYLKFSGIIQKNKTIQI